MAIDTNNAFPTLPRGIQTGPLAAGQNVADTVAAVVAQVVKLAADTGAVAPADWAAAATGADIDNINLDNNELRALDNMMQTFLADGTLSAAEQKTFQEVRSLFARDGGKVTIPKPPVKEPAGGGVPTTPPVAEPAWPVGTAPIKGNTFRSWGDPHETTGDGLTFDNMKQGTFVKLKSASGDFELQTTQGKDASGRWPNATLNHKAAVKAGADVVAYDGLAKTMTINGKATPIPAEGKTINLPDGGKVTGTKDGITITTAKGDEVSIHQKDAYIDISGAVSPKRLDGEVRGSLGAFDADTDKGNEMLGRTGTAQIKGTDAFLEEWRVKPGENLTDPAGGGGPQVDPFEADTKAEFAKRDITGNGYLSGTEIPADFKAANPTVTRVTEADFLAFRQKQEATALAADKKAFAAADKNNDFQLDGNEVGANAKYDKGGNFGAGVEVTDMEYLAGKANERRASRWADIGGAPAVATNPPGGGVPNPPGGGVTTPPVVKIPGDDAPVKPIKPKTGDDIKPKLTAAQREAQVAKNDLDAFNRLDRNNDGVLTGEQTLKKVGKFDANGDGKVTAAEFIDGRAKERAEAAFKKADRNGDGVLTGEQTLKRYGKFDANGDGKVTKEEFVAGRLAQSQAARDTAKAEDKLDTNHNGFVSFMERAKGTDEEAKRRAAAEAAAKLNKK